MAAPSEHQVFQFGSQTIVYEPPDVFAITLVGDLSAEELIGIGQTFKLAPGKFYVVLGTAKLDSFGSAAKKVIKEVPIASGVAIHGASRQMQLVLSILNKVYMMVNLGKDMPLTFVSTEEDARKWVEYQRVSNTRTS